MRNIECIIIQRDGLPVLTGEWIYFQNTYLKLGLFYLFSFLIFTFRNDHFQIIYTTRELFINQVEEEFEHIKILPLPIVNFLPYRNFKITMVRHTPRSTILPKKSIRWSNTQTKQRNNLTKFSFSIVHL